MGGKAGLSLQEVRNLRHAAGIADDESSNPLEQIDAHTLPGERVFLVTAAGSGHCLEVNVFQRSGRNFKEIWSTHEMPDGSRLCHPSLCRDPVAFAGKKNQITIVVPVQLEDAPMGMCDANIVLTYRGKGKTYVLASSDRRTTECSVDDYLSAVRQAFEDAESSSATQPLVTLRVLPSSRPESDIVLEKTANGFEVTHLSFTQQALSQLGVLNRRQVPSKCMAAVRSMQIERMPVNISSNDVQRLLDDLHKIDLHMDSCPRRMDGTCAELLDGTSYLLVMENGQTLRLSGITGLKDIASENPALSKWIASLRQFVKAREQGTGK